MRRYAVGRYLPTAMRERAARASYVWTSVMNNCQRGCCWEQGDTTQAIRSADSGVCPIGVAFASWQSPDAFEAEATLSTDVYGRTNARRLKALQDFIHDIDSGKIGPDQVAEALGVTP